MKAMVLVLTLALVAVGLVAAAPAEVYPAGMISYWRLNEATGTVAKDSVGTNDGTITNANWSTSCVSGSCIQSASRGATYVAVPYQPSLNVSGDKATVEAWVYPFASSWGDGQGNCGFVAMTDSYGLCVGGWWRGAFQFVVTTQNGWASATSPQDFPAGSWYHMVGVYDGTELRLYVNGVLNSSAAQHGSIAASTSPLWMGSKCGDNGYDWCLYGKVDEVAVYDRALTQAEILRHYQNGLAGAGYEMAAPVVTVTFPAPTHGSGGWFNAQDTMPVVGQVVADDSTTGGSHITAIDCTGAVMGPISGLGTQHATASLNVQDEGSSTVTCTATDSAQNNGAAPDSSNTATVAVDRTAPGIVISSPASTAYLLGQVVPSDYTCTDGGSGMASCAGTVANGSGIDTATVGNKTFTVNAHDAAGNANSANVAYNVIYRWTGFAPPVDTLPTLNLAKAGSAIPVKFSLGGNQGLDIFAAAYPKVTTIACPTSAPSDVIDQTVSADRNSLSYDPATDQYNFVWKTNKAWAGTCQQLVVTLVDGTVHLANFGFK